MECFKKIKKTTLKFVNTTMVDTRNFPTEPSTQTESTFTTKKTKT